MSARPPLGALGLHRLAFFLAMLQLTLLAANIVGFSLLPVSSDWSGLRSTAPIFLLLVIAWVAHVWMPGSRREWHRADTLLALMMLATVSYCLGPLQYVAVSLQRPLIDTTLAAADTAMGIHVPAIVDWASRHDILSRCLSLAYYSYLPQLGIPLLIAGMWYRDRSAVWEFLFNFHVCATITVFCLAVWPADSAFTFYGFESLLNQARFIRHFAALRQGTLSAVDPGDLEGLVSFPSLHVAGALAVTWAMRRYRYWLAGLTGLNAALIAATVVLGAHYFIDLIGGFVVFAVSAASWHLLKLDRAVSTTGSTTERTHSTDALRPASTDAQTVPATRHES